MGEVDFRGLTGCPVFRGIDTAALHPSTHVNWTELRTAAIEEIEATLLQLPEPLRDRARAVPVTLEPSPNAGLQEDGIAPDTLGLFVGPDFSAEGSIPMPPQIILFLENLQDLAECDPEIFRDEVRATFLHELGHYLGLDEDDLTDRGLE